MGKLTKWHEKTPEEIKKEKLARKTTLVRVEDGLEKNRNKYDSVLVIMPVDNFIQLFIAEIKGNQKLLDCDPTTILVAAMKVAKLNLKLELDQVYLVARKIKNVMTCCAEYGYIGLLKLAYNGGVLADTNELFIYEGEFFEQKVVNNRPIINHTAYNHPSMRIGGINARPLGIFGIASLKTGGEKLLVLWDDPDMNAIKQLSPICIPKPWDEWERWQQTRWLNSPWVKHEKKMWKKALLLRLLQFIPLGVSAVNSQAIEKQIEKQVLDVEQPLIGALPN